MTRCLNCGAEISSEPCESCGLSALEAALFLRRHVLNLTAVFLLGGIAFLPASQSYPPLELDAMLIFVGLLFFFTLALAVWLDIRARRGAQLEALRRVFRSLVPAPWLLAGLLLANGRLDLTPPRRHVTAVMGKFSMPGFVPSTRLLVVSWRPGRRMERVPVSREDYARFHAGDLVEVRLQEGLVGIPWVDSVRRK